jgi:hydrogenase-4 component F
MIQGFILSLIFLAVMAYVIPWRRIRRGILVTAAVYHLVFVLFMNWIRPEPALHGWLAVDSIGLLFLNTISVVFLMSAVYGAGYLSRHLYKPELQHKDPERFFIASLLIFLATMSLVTLTHHFGLLWVAIEATTLASAPLIYYYRSLTSLEATWKYLLICSVGIALALFGTFFLAAASFGHANGPLTVQYLTGIGHGLDAHLIRLAFIFLIVGYGTKMGLVPMHTWLPDAHSEAPSFISSLLSGVLLNCAFLGILRSYQVCAAAGEAVFAQNIMLAFGILSMLLAAVFILFQNDYKRLLAYSSVEHMGILSFGMGLGPAAYFFVLFHAINHSFTKSMLFLTSGNILAVYDSKSIKHVKGLLKASPVTGWLWLCGFLAIAGMPLFGIFISEFNILGTALLAHRVLAALVFLFLLTVIFIAMMPSFLSMIQGSSDSIQPVKEPAWRWIPPLLLLLITLILGLFIPGWLTHTLNECAVQLRGVQ